MKLLSVVLVVVLALQTVQAANILAVCCAATHSHSIWCYEYMVALSERGHQITVLGVDTPRIKISNLTTFIDTGVYDFEKELRLNIVDVFGHGSKIGTMYFFKDWNEANTIGIMKSKALKDLMKHYENVEKPFDLIIHDSGSSEALLGLVPYFGDPPLLLATTYGIPQYMTSRVGDMLNPAFVPTMISSYDQHMTFFERCQNTFYYIFLEIFLTYVIDPFQDKLMREVFGQHLPPMTEIAKRSNIIIVNYHFALNDPRPLLPGVVGIAGLQITQPKPLPQNLQDFMDGAKNGVILISFGTNLFSEMLPKDLTDIIIEAVRPLPQRVLWKWDKEVPNAPANVKITNWLPQTDILAHPNLQLFVTHCGLLSTQEVIYRKKRILALPVFFDQIENAAMLVKRNLTIQLNLYELTVDDLRNGIKQILSNDMYKTNIEHFGDLMVDMPQTAKQQAVFWTEYVIRHKGAPHLRSAAADMSWFQLLLLDVLATFLLLITISFLVLKCLVIFSIKIVKKCTRPKQKNE